MNNFLDLSTNIINRRRNVEDTIRILNHIVNSTEEYHDFNKIILKNSEEHLKLLLDGRNNVKQVLENSFETLKKTNTFLEDRNNELRKQIVEVQLQFESDVNILKNSNKQLESQIQQLLTEIHSMQGNPSFELNESALKLKSQLTDSNASLKQVVNSAQTLREELQLLKVMHLNERTQIEKEIRDLKCDLELASGNNIIMQDKCAKVKNKNNYQPDSEKSKAEEDNEVCNIHIKKKLRYKPLPHHTSRIDTYSDLKSVDKKLKIPGKSFRDRDLSFFENFLSETEVNIRDSSMLYDPD